ncbi:MAG: hypothetical protein JJE47_01680 [Acidimicrobiia bacterium]|nr:hypothetical protein [Acidimicrobiia bacterium]
MMKKILSAAVVASVVMVGALPAFADIPNTEDGPSTVYDDVNHLLLFEVDGVCTLTEDMDVTLTFDENEDPTFAVDLVDETSEIDLEELTGGCMAISVEGPNGQVNHGTVVSSIVKALKEMDLDGPLGQALKAYAKSGLGKGDMQIKANEDDEAVLTTDESATLTGDASDRPGKPDKGNRSNKSNNGRGHNK